ncbi:hypothetical protein B0H34DRAFT_781185 [Crassisporium funariophilum]|nr:hypothetical protein B0H34DRAFT_781185 [Crassisporium funariophilum]
MPASTTLISTKGWSLDTLIEKGDNFQQVHRVSAASSSLLETIVEFDKKGIPLVLEGWHKHPNWPHDKFTPEYFASNTTPNINVRNIHDWTDSEMPLLEYIDKSRAISPFVVDGENERLYGKDAECPESWEDWLHNGKAIPPSLVCNGPDDLFRYRPNSAPVETLMCYLGIGDTFTPCHKDLCGSSGQNVMCYTENDGSSFWFMTESASAPLVADYFHSLGQELDHENYVVSIEELSRAPFKVYIVEQKLGDMVLVPPRSCHQVVNYGGITLKTSWSRMTFKGLATAYYHELPLYRRVCRFETYRVKSTIHWALVGQTKELKTLLCDAGEPGPMQTAKKVRPKTFANYSYYTILFWLTSMKRIAGEWRAVHHAM